MRLTLWQRFLVWCYQRHTERFGSGVVLHDPISAAVASVGAFFAEAGAGIAAATGLTGATLGGVGAGALIGGGLEGAAIGALGGGALNAITGKPILAGIGEGALVGGAIGGFGPAIGGALGGGSAAGVAGDVLAGAGAGALGGAVIPGAGGPGAGALGGATSGLIAGASSGLFGQPPGAVGSPTTGGPGASAAGIAAPPGVGDANPFGSAVPDAASPATYGATTGFGAAPATGGGDIYGGASGATTGTSLTSFTGPPAGQSDLFTGATTSTPLATGATTDAANAPGGSGGVDFAGATSASDPATLGQAYAGTYPLPPVPPSLDASGNPTAGFDTLGQAQAANVANATDIGGGVVPSGSSGAGKLGYSINPAAGVDPSTPAGAGAGGTYTLAQGATAGTAPASGNSFSNLISDPSFSNLGDFASKNASLLLGVGSLGLDALKGNQPLPGESNITGIANQLSGQATQLQSYLTNGTLPPGVSTALTQAGSAAKAAIRSQYAAKGMSGSSAEVQDLSNVDNTLVSQGATIATTLLNQGITEANLAAGLYGQIMNTALTQDNQLSGALGTLAAAAARPTITVTPSGALAQAS